MDYPVKPYFTVCDISDITNHSMKKNQKNKLLLTKEALIGEHNLLTGHKESIDW